MLEQTTHSKLLVDNRTPGCLTRWCLARARSLSSPARALSRSVCGKVCIGLIVCFWGIAVPRKSANKAQSVRWFSGISLVPWKIQLHYHKEEQHRANRVFSEEQIILGNFSHGANFSLAKSISLVSITTLCLSWQRVFSHSVFLLG